MNDDVTKLQEQNEKLVAENKELKDELNRIKKSQNMKNKAMVGLTAFAIKVLIGHSLINSTKALVRSTLEEKRFAVDETADFIASVIRRFIRVGLVGILISLIPFLLLIHQNILLSQQNSKIQTQIDWQENDARFARRAELLRTIYDTKIDHRVRIESIKAYVEMERTKLKQTGDEMSLVDLSGVNLQNAYLQNFNFEKVDFSHADLDGAKFANANLQGASFRKAELEGVDFSQTNLKEADLSHANLQTADFTSANLEKAVLRYVDLRFAKLWETTVKNADFGNANMQQTTIYSIEWKKIENIKQANVSNVNIRLDSMRREFLDWAEKNGAIVN